MTIDELESSIENLKEDLNAKNLSLSKLKKSLDIERASKAENEAKFLDNEKNLKKHIQELESSANDLEDTIEEMQSQLDERDETVTYAEEQITILSKELAERKDPRVQKSHRKSKYMSKQPLTFNQTRFLSIFLIFFFNFLSIYYTRFFIWNKVLMADVWFQLQPTKPSAFGMYLVLRQAKFKEKAWRLEDFQDRLVSFVEWQHLRKILLHTQCVVVFGCLYFPLNWSVQFTGIIFSLFSPNHLYSDFSNFNLFIDVIHLFAISFHFD